MTSFIGTTKECLEHYAQAGSDPTRILRCLPQIDRRTAERWLKGEQFPIGGNLIRLRVFLTLHDYQVTEWNNLHSVILDSCKLYALDIVSFEELAATLGYHKDASLLEVMRGKRNMQATKLEPLTKLVGKNLSILQKREKELEALREVKTPEGSLLFGARLPNAGTTDTKVLFRAPSDRKRVIDGLVSVIEALRPLAEIVLSDAFSPAERAHLRETVGKESFFATSNTLNALCSERARSHLGFAGGKQ